MTLPLVRAIYSLGVLATSPGVLTYLTWRALVQKKELSLAERFGRVKARGPAPGGRVWVHSVSAGEAAAASPVLRALKQQRPEVELLVSTTTSAGWEMAQRLAPEGTQLQAYPVDWGFCVEPSLSRSQPDVVVLVELEIWPNFIEAARRRGIPVMLISGRISDRGIRRAVRVRPWMEWALTLLSFLGMQTKADAERALRLGARPKYVHVLGNTKFDEESGPLPVEEVLALRESLGLTPEIDLLLAGSTRPGEEKALLEAYSLLRRRHSTVRLALAPRHLERTSEVQSLVESAGFRPVLRSKGAVEEPLGPDSVLVLDTMGELARLYAAATLSFVGGSLVPIGGHNLLQPVAQGVPVLFGPHTENSRDVTALLLQKGVGIRVKDAGEIAQVAGRLLSSPDELPALRGRCLETLEENRGASSRYAAEILRLMDDHRERTGRLSKASARPASL
ncbi:MAG TPA: 3-deoxy-D-manno-octulosonic acid transferase [Armatimonadota bacterium]|jgi:3-deoxy-D-manno-octulosonic-acid transferase